MRKILVTVSFFLGAPLLIFTCIFYLSYLYTESNGQVLGTYSNGIAYAALPPSDVAFSVTINEEASQIELVRQFLESHNSPLEPYAPDLIAASERYDLDFRLLPAIAMQESTLCRKVPVGSNNCWGWGIYGGKVTSFDSDDAFITKRQILATNGKIHTELLDQINKYKNNFPKF